MIPQTWNDIGIIFTFAAISSLSAFIGGRYYIRYLKMIDPNSFDYEYTLYNVSFNYGNNNNKHHKNNNNCCITVIKMLFPYAIIKILIISMIIWYNYNLLTFMVWYLLIAGVCTFIGSLIGYRKDGIEAPGRVRKICRDIPPKPWYLNTWLTIFIGGFFPFIATISILHNNPYNFLYSLDLTSCLSNIWFVLTNVCAAVLMIMFVSGTISIIYTYFRLRSEDYHWWWYCLAVPASSALYFFTYCIIMFTFSENQSLILTNELQEFALGYNLVALSFMASVGLFFVTGASGFLMTCSFLLKLYQPMR